VSEPTVKPASDLAESLITGDVGAIANLTRRDVVRAIDWEIASVDRQTQSSGFTAWTLTAALGGVLWLLVRESTLPWSAIRDLLFLILGFSLLVDLAEMLDGLLAPPTPEIRLVARVISPQQVFGPLRREFAYYLPRAIALSIIAYSDHSLPVAFRSLIIVWYALHFVLTTLALLGSMLSISLAQNEPAHRRRAAIANVIVAALLVSAAASFWWWFWTTKSVYLSSCYRVALLIVGVGVLVRLNFLSRRQTPLLERLRVLRRETALMMIAPGEAADTLDFLISGQTVKAYREMELRRREVALRSVKEKVAGLVTGAEGLQDRLAKMEPVSAEQRNYELGRVNLHWKAVELAHTEVRRGEKFSESIREASEADSALCARRNEFEALIAGVRGTLPRYEKILEECRSRLRVTPIKDG
jgi:hypothetical protein